MGGEVEGGAGDDSASMLPDKLLRDQEKLGLPCRCCSCKQS